MKALTFVRAIQDDRSYLSNHYGQSYEIRKGVWNYHTGIDVLFVSGNIAHAPIYSISWGRVTYAQRVTVPGFESWGDIIVVRTELVDGKIVYVRYGHVENMLVHVGDTIHPGQQIASVGNAYGTYAYHLHLDISRFNDATMLNAPYDWPGADYQRVLDHYQDPNLFKERYGMVTGSDPELEAASENVQAAAIDLDIVVKARTQGTPPIPTFVVRVINDSTNIRSTPAIANNVIRKVAAGTLFTVSDPHIIANSFSWYKIMTEEAYIASSVVNPM
jgi:murein DD-endopeptidase MepM/ murein hydrolase activator NlpD